LVAGLIESEAARCDDDDLGLRCSDLLPRHRDGSITGASENWFTASSDNEVGHPVTGSEGRFDPLQDEDAAPRELVNGRKNLHETSSQ
jgi:hypothetical protein